MYYSNDSLVQANKEMWLIEINDKKDILRDHMLSLDVILPDSDTKIMLSTINKQLGELKRQQQQIERIFLTTKNIRILEHQMKNELLFAYNEFNRSIRELTAAIQTKENKMLADIEKQQTFFYRILSLLVLLGFFLTYFGGIRLLLGVFYWIKDISEKLQALSHGNLPPYLAPRNNEFKDVAQSINKLNTNLSALREFAREVGKGNFESDKTIFDADSDLGASLQEMSSSLQRVYDEERKRNWTSQGLAEFTELIRANSDSLDNLCRVIVSRLVKHLDATQGGVFLLKAENERPFFELKASFAYDRQKFNQKQVDVNEGLIGRVYNEREIVYLSDLPPDYMDISSGLGNAEPKALVLLPLINEENDLIGIIELASLKAFKDYHLEFLNKLGTSMASTLTMIQNSQRNTYILEKT
ncbi:MAG: GAF domain-containing protein [Bacteroidia bacterium]|nr:GAF domain-containing protein [Bacteroidia bacterium]